MVQVYLARNPADAHMLKAVLKSNGIDCLVQGDQLFQLLGEIPLSQESVPSVWILDTSKFSDAEDIINEYKRVENSNVSEENIWTCPSCGEESYAQFSECWKCGISRDDNNHEK